MGDSNEKEATLTEVHVIIIACVCGFIIICLLIVLFCFIFRRRRNAAKAYHGGNPGDPPPYSAVSPHKKTQVYDNQDGALDLHTGYSIQYPGSTSGPRQENMKDAWSATQIRFLSTNNTKFTYKYNIGIDGCPTQDGVSGVAQSPSKDKYIGLQDRGAGGGGGPVMVSHDAGHNMADHPAATGKPKKVIYEVVV